MAVKVRDMIIASVATKGVFRRFAALSDDEKAEVVRRVKEKMDGGGEDNETVLEDNDKDTTLDVKDDLTVGKPEEVETETEDSEFDTSHSEEAAELMTQAMNGELEDDAEEEAPVEESGMSEDPNGDGQMMGIVDGLTKEVEQIKSDGKVEKSEVMGLFDSMMQMVTLLINSRAPVKPRAKSASRRTAVEFDTKKEMQDYKKNHEIAPGTKLTVKKGPASGKKQEVKKPSRKQKKKEQIKQQGKSKKKAPKDKGKGKKPEENNTDGKSKKEKPSFRQGIKDLGSKIKESVANAPAEVKKLVTDEKYRNEQLASVAEGVKKAPKKIGTAIAKSAKAEVKEIKHGGKAIGKLAKGEKLDREDKHAIYAVGVYAAGTALAAATGGAGGAAIALAHSFKLHVAIKAIHTMADEGFLGFEAFHSVHHALDAISHVAAEDVGDDERNQDVLVNWVTASVLKVLEEGIPQEDMDDIMNGVNYEDGLKSIEHLNFKNASSDMKEARVSSRIARSIIGH